MSEEPNVDAAKSVLVSLGAPVEQYPICGEVDWVEVTRRYGQRFAYGYLCQFPYRPASRRWDAFMETGELPPREMKEQWVLAAGDVRNVGETIAACMVREALGEGENTNAVQGLLRLGVPSFADYANVCDNRVLLRHGIVFAYTLPLETLVRLDTLESYLTDDQRDELKGILR